METFPASSGSATGFTRQKTGEPYRTTGMRHKPTGKHYETTGTGYKPTGEPYRATGMVISLRGKVFP